MPFLSHAVSGTNGAHAPHVRDHRAAILEAYAEAHGNKSRVAALLGVSRKTLYARLKRLNLQLP